MREGRAVLVAPAADPDDPLDPGACHLDGLGGPRRVTLLRTGEHGLGDVARARGAAPVLAFTGPRPGDALALAAAVEFATVAVLPSLTLLPLRAARAAARGAGEAFGAALAMEEAAWKPGLDLAVLARPMGRQGAGMRPLLAGAAALVSSDAAILRRATALAGRTPAGGAHLLPAALLAERIERLAAAAPPPGPVLVTGAGTARTGFPALRALTRAPGASLLFSGPEAVPCWPLLALAGGLGIGGRVGWRAAAGRGALARLIAGSAGLLALGPEPDAQATLIARALGRPVIGDTGAGDPERLGELLERAAARAAPARPDAEVLDAHAPGRVTPLLAAVIEAVASS